MDFLRKYLNDPCGTASLPYWKLEKTSIPIDMLILHDKNYTKSMYENYQDEPYFRLYHSLKNIRKPLNDSVEILYGVSYMNAFVKNINESYIDIRVTKWDLEKYKESSVFCSDLWILLKDKASGTIIGSGIACLDYRIKEGSIEWVQVLPQYRNHGFGQLIVNTLLSKMAGTADFATVSGKQNDSNSPLKMYRKCGFTGNDIWHILTKRNL